MRYTWPKFKLCRREGMNLFGSDKYILKKGTSLPGKPKNARSMSRLTEYAKLLRNKQSLKRMYSMTERQFYTLVTKTSQKYAKNNGLSHDQVMLQFLERRCDAVLLKSGIANTIMQARQMMTHGHWMLNGRKHNIPSYFMKPGDVLSLREKMKGSALYSQVDSKGTIPAWIKVDKNKLSVELLDMPDTATLNSPVDLLKVIEFYARA